MNRRHRAIVTGIHRLQHIESFFAAALPNHDAIGTHTQGVDKEFSLPNRSLAFQVGRTGLQPHNVRLLQLELGRVLDRNHALDGRNVGRQGVQHGRLA